MKKMMRMMRIIIMIKILMRNNEHNRYIDENNKYNDKNNKYINEYN